ncbi:MAG: hypothetical protein M0R69_02720 [Candidatus Cloacimonetes bacterium]|jgi:hypothetical protein|nr:hypothetical protein [Candidatus Cloacimonadota bacterium]
MRLFKQILLLLLVLLSLGLVSIAVRARIARANVAPQICPGAPKTLILGDSHARTALNPEFIRSSCSSAQKAEELEYSYYKLKQALQTPNSLENIILAVSYFNFNGPVDGEAEMMNRYHRLVDQGFYRDKQAHGEYSAAIRFRHLMDYKLPAYSPFGLLNDIIEAQTEPMFRGGYELRRGSLIGQRRALDGAIQRHYYQGNSLRKISSLRTAYFARIVELCHQKGVTLWVINTPLHQDYRSGVPIEPVSHYQKLMAQGEQNFLSQYGQGLLENDQELLRKDQELAESGQELLESVSADFIFLDYSTLNLPDSFFFDYDHLNGEGASFFSQLIDQLINRSTGVTLSSDGRPISFNGCVQ